MIKLTIRSSSGPPREISVEEGSLVVGRAPDCDVVVEDSVFSRRHLRFVAEGGRLSVEDLGSSNGTLLNGQLLSGVATVGSGDLLKVSATEISIHVAGPETPVVATPIPATPMPTAPPAGVTVMRPLAELLPQQPAPAAESGDAAALGRYAARLELLTELHRALGQSIEIETLLELVLDGAFEHLQPEEAIIMLERGAGLEVVAWRSSTADEAPAAVSETLIREVVERGQGVLALDVHSDERFSDAKSILASGARSLCAAPLLYDEQRLGMIALSSSLGVRAFAEEDLELLAALASVTALRIRNLELAEHAAERERLESELAFARKLQLSLLPKELPAIEGYSLVARNEASRGVSGDYYQAVVSGSDDCLVLVADVCGKGMGASLLAASMEATCSALIAAGHGEPHEVLAGANNALFERTPPDRFATAFMVAVAPGEGRIRYVNAGHNPPLVLRSSGELEELEATGFPLGMMPDSEYASTELELEVGELVVIFTDGIVEAANPQGEEYQLERLIAVLRERSADPLEEIADAVEQALTTFAAGVPFHDDCTLVMIRRE